MDDFETAVKLHIYSHIAKTTVVPTAKEVASAVGAPVAKVEEAFKTLGQKRLLVLEPGFTNQIRMAPPFSGIETPFRVEVREKLFYANCVWDALGIAAALNSDAVVSTVCGNSGEPMTLRVSDGEPVPQDCVIHFAVPTAKWWSDIIYT